MCLLSCDHTLTLTVGQHFADMFEKGAKFAAEGVGGSTEFQSGVVLVWAKSCPKATLCQLQLCIKRTAPQTRVPEVHNLDPSGLLAGCTLRTCSRNTTNSEIQRLHFAHVFEEYDEFGDPAAVLCTRVRRHRMRIEHDQNEFKRERELKKFQ